MTTPGMTERMSAKWDSYANQKFVELCVKETKNGNRVGRYFSPIGWKNLIANFNLETGRNYNRNQLKNRWEVMKSEWAVFNQMMQGESGIGWDDVRKTIAADDNWWTQKIKANEKYKKFRGKDLSLIWFCYHTLFSDVAGNTALTLSQHSHVVDEYTDTNLNNSGSGDSREGARDDKTMPTLVYEPVILRPSIYAKRKPNDEIESGSKRRFSDASQLSESIDNFIKMGKEMTVQRAATEPLAPSISDCIKVLYSMEGIEEGSSFFCYVLNMFKVTENREIFFAIRTPKERLNWLKYEFDHSQGTYLCGP